MVKLIKLNLYLYKNKVKFCKLSKNLLFANFQKLQFAFLYAIILLKANYV